MIADKPPLSEVTHATTKHDLIFYENRSTPKVVTQGASFDAPESYGKQTYRRAATEEEEKVIARGDWLRVDQSGKKGGQDGYKKTRMPGREHLVKHESDGQASMDEETQAILDEAKLVHYGVLGMKWGKHRAKASSSDIRRAREGMARQQRNYGRLEDSLDYANPNSAKNKKIMAEMDRMEKAWREDPQRVTAARMTRGEKALAVLVSGPIGLAAIAVTSAQSRGIEARQDKRAGRKP